PGQDALLATIGLTDAAVCTSGSYERTTPSGLPHLVDARTATPTTDLASVSVIAPTAMAADGLSTAAFVLGASAGLRFLEQHRVQSLLVRSDRTHLVTSSGFADHQVQPNSKMATS